MLPGNGVVEIQFEELMFLAMVTIHWPKIRRQMCTSHYIDDTLII